MVTLYARQRGGRTGFRRLPRSIRPVPPPSPTWQLRRLGTPDVPFLNAMFGETVTWRDEAPPRALADILSDPDLARYVAQWGRDGDAGLVALSTSGVRVGAAWSRTFGEAHRGYGFIAEDIPELGIGVVPEHRGEGVGRALMVGLIELARDEGYRALSLSVEIGNVRAERLYEDLGFLRIEKVGGSWTMLMELAP